MDLFNPKYIKDELLPFIKNNHHRIDVNEKLFHIYEGQIGPILDEKLRMDLGEKSFDRAKERKVTVNILQRLIDKISKIYQQEPKRTVIGGNDNDKKILERFEDLLDINQNLNINNEIWNLYYYSLLQIGIDYGKPFIRTIPNHKFLIKNESKVNPTSPDVVILFMDKKTDINGEYETYWAYTDTLFVIFDSKGEIKYDEMEALGQDGFIPYGKKPFVYQNKSKNLAMPLEQSDTLNMTLHIPLLLTDTAYIAKYTAFSILYGIDVDDSEMAISPNAFWNFKSDPDTDKAPSVGVIKPEGDIDKLVNLAITHLEIWLNTKGIKPSSIGDVSTANVSSGIAKLIDEADITDLRKLQVMLYKKFEFDFWELLLKKIYPFWVEQGLIENFGTFSPSAYVSVEFTPQTPMLDRNTLIETITKELEAGLTTKRRALRDLNPGMPEDELEQLLTEIENENIVEVIEYGTKQNRDKIDSSDTKEV